MITEKEVLLYEEYGGWVDGYLIKNSIHRNTEFESMDWSLISQLIGDIVLITNKKASPDFQEKLVINIRQNTENCYQPFEEASKKTITRSLE